jgi:hypothetical protein
MCGCGQRRFFTQNRQLLIPQNKNRINNIKITNVRANNRNISFIQFGRNHINSRMQVSRRLH